MAVSKQDRRAKIKLKLRKTIKGTPQAPRLSVYRSNAEIYAQLVDDKGGKTLLAVVQLINQFLQQKLQKLKKRN